jgi:hypothetical protein
LRIRGLCSWFAVACFPLAGAFHVWAKWYANRMSDRGEGWEMAFYFSPLAFMVMDVLLILAGVLGLVGLFVGPRWYHRGIAVCAELGSVVWYTLLPWR